MSIESNIRQFIGHFTQLTVRISLWNEDETLTGRSSGFLYQPPDSKNLYVITAGHGTPKKGAFIETRIQKNGTTLSLNGGSFKVFHTSGEIDYAYSKLPIEKYSELDDLKDLDFIAYRYQFQPAIKNDAYGFAVLNNYEFIKSGDQLLLHTYSCFEVGLELEDQNETINYFKPYEFKGDDYYVGASGAPIADPEGIITSILIGGDPESGLLKAMRLDNISLEIE